MCPSEAVAEEVPDTEITYNRTEIKHLAGQARTTCLSILRWFDYVAVEEDGTEHSQEWITEKGLEMREDL